MTIETFRIPNETRITFDHGWTGVVVDQRGPNVWVTYGENDVFIGFVTIPRDCIVNRRVTVPVLVTA
jgi:hypothetical protein